MFEFSENCGQWIQNAQVICLEWKTWGTAIDITIENSNSLKKMITILKGPLDFCESEDKIRDRASIEISEYG